MEMREHLRYSKTTNSLPWKEFTATKLDNLPSPQGVLQVEDEEDDDDGGLNENEVPRRVSIKQIQESSQLPTRGTDAEIQRNHSGGRQDAGSNSGLRRSRTRRSRPWEVLKTVQFIY